jgi:magnesium transporter
MSDIRVILYDPASNSVQSGGNALIDEWRQRPNCHVWVDFAGNPDAAERQLLQDGFAIPLLAINDAQRDRHPPKLEVFEKIVFIMLRDLIEAYQDSDPEVAQLAMFIGKNFVVTRHQLEVPSVASIFRDAQGDTQHMADGPGHIGYLVVRRIVDRYTPEVLALEEHLANLEDLVFERPNDDVVEMLSRYNRALKRLRRHLVYQCNVMAQLSRPAGPLPVALNLHEFTDLFENLERLASLCQLNQELTVDLLNTHLSLLSHRLNQVMRVLTIATVIFLPLGLLAGIYGMNFERMPELGWHYGYFGVLAAMATVVISLITIFKKRRWL